MQNPVLEAIYRRRSVREFTPEQVSTEVLQEIIRAGIWAPSGLNNQPWRFVLVGDEQTREQLAALTKYQKIVLAAPALIAVFLDQNAMYDQVKDHQAAGACIQNMLLAAEALGLGAVWLGQILHHKDQVRQVLKLDDHLDLMAVIALGRPVIKERHSQRKPLEDFILKSI
ncbi:nitroreductase family protein [Desulfurivibrio dismutans]|uniref:nitroreductase family protein n=1 Tax=Desulfurivibrio dismutans TaxID=1398908 RepID=UPI0023DC7CBE|nr:nitroreductase [Desulfurivibrio alkaliphilus]MDF1615353.1 nitroreductase [Desulfurivibrio alkaliphilus]